jgi:hypothetical protein
VDILEEIDLFTRIGKTLLSQGEVRPGIVQGQHWGLSFKAQEEEQKRRLREEQARWTPMSSSGHPPIIWSNQVPMMRSVASTPDRRPNPRLSHPVKR